MASGDGGSSSSVTVDEHGQKVRLVSPGLISVGLVLIPNAMMMRAHLNGGTKKIVDWVIHRSPSAPHPPSPLSAEAEKARRAVGRIGDYAFFLVPFVGLSLEKSFYDTAMSIQGVDPNAARLGAPRPPHLPPTTATPAPDLAGHALLRRPEGRGVPGGRARAAEFLGAAGAESAGPLGRDPGAECRRRGAAQQMTAAKPPDEPSCVGLRPT